MIFTKSQCRRFLECLASGIAVMEHGNAALEGDSWNEQVIHKDSRYSPSC